MKHNPLRPKWFLPVGAIDAAFGVFSLSHLFEFTVILAVWALIAGCARVYMFYTVRSSGAARCWPVLGSALLMIAAAVLLLSKLPVAGVLTGVFLAVIGASVVNEGRTLYRGPLSPPAETSANR
jgi:uncharacterized membrane protein HdeD (DUF308 family)